MTEREDKTPVAPSGAAEEQEILLDSPIVESEDEPGAVDAPGVSGSKEPDEAAVESTPVVEEDAVEPVPPVEEAIAGNPEAAASADADASAGLPEIPEGASSAWPQEETLPAPAAGGEPPAPVDRSQLSRRAHVQGNVRRRFRVRLRVRHRGPAQDPQGSHRTPPEPDRSISNSSSSWAAAASKRSRPSISASK